MRTISSISLKRAFAAILLSGSFLMNAQNMRFDSVKKTDGRNYAVDVRENSNTTSPGSYDASNHKSNTVSTLVIDLSAFSAIPAEGQVNISWATASERNNEYFLVERSVNGLNWEVMTSLKGAGNSSTEQHYNCVDLSPYAEEIFYYRLKQVHFNGDISYSDIVAVEMKDQPEKIRLYPNPSVSHIKIIMDSKTSKECTVSFYNAVGQLAKQITGDLTVMLIDVTDLEAGNYFAVIDSGTKRSRAQFVKN